VGRRKRTELWKGCVVVKLGVVIHPLLMTVLHLRCVGLAFRFPELSNKVWGSMTKRGAGWEKDMTCTVSLVLLREWHLIVLD
jgi:hypothetical protein